MNKPKVHILQIQKKLDDIMKPWRQLDDIMKPLRQVEKYLHRFRVVSSPSDDPVEKQIHATFGPLQTELACLIRIEGKLDRIIELLDEANHHTKI